VTTDSDPMLRMVTALVVPPGEMSQQVFREGIDTLRAYLRRRYSPPLAPVDIDQLATDAISQFFEASRRGNVQEDGNPTGYLLKIANRMAQAAIRTARRTVSADADMTASLALTDEAAAARLDRLANVAVVRQAMADAWRDRDATVVRVATYLLDEIQRTGSVPSSRRAGEALGLSHAGVAKAVRRLKAYLIEADRHQ
jgi:DNA-directed RNA polymerase specialized sigma24 family protein